MSFLFPLNCTDLLQPLDISVNKPLQAEIRIRFVIGINWYSDKVKVGMYRKLQRANSEYCQMLKNNISQRHNVLTF